MYESVTVASCSTSLVVTIAKTAAISAQEHAPIDVKKGLGRRSYGWQRDGGHADYILCDAPTLIKMSPFMTYLDAAMVACGW
jgi:hypothetical protein